MKWLVYAWSGNERDGLGFEIVDTREQVMAFALQVVGEFTITTEQDSNIEGKPRSGGVAWFSAVMVPPFWESNYDEMWLLHRCEGIPPGTYMSVYENPRAPAHARWEPCVDVKVPIRSEIEDVEYETKIHMESYGSHLDAIQACERAAKVAAGQINEIGRRAVAFVDRELATAVGVAEIRRAGASEEKE